LDFDPNKLDILITAKESSRSPYFNIIKENAEGFCEKLIATNYVRRQDVPKTYDMTTVFYITTFRNILNASSVFSGRVGLFEVDQISALDIDTEFDLRMAEFFLKEKKNNEESK
jgi:N-acylneuraminate cytidylyltransferase